MVLSWLKNLMRRALPAEPFPPQWLSYLESNFGHYIYLSGEERSKLRDTLRIFIAEKHWEGCGGLVVTEEMRVTIAAQACLLLLGIDHDHYSDVETILIYPGGFRVPVTRQEGFLVTEDEKAGRDLRCGQPRRPQGVGEV